MQETLEEKMKKIEILLKSKHEEKTNKKNIREKQKNEKKKTKKKSKGMNSNTKMNNVNHLNNSTKEKQDNISEVKNFIEFRKKELEINELVKYTKSKKKRKAIIFNNEKKKEKKLDDKNCNENANLCEDYNSKLPLKNLKKNEDKEKDKEKEEEKKEEDDEDDDLCGCGVKNVMDINIEDLMLDDN
jgi:DnaJ family protein A protein 5